MPNGLIYQWGFVEKSNIVFPIPFPNKCLSISAEMFNDKWTPDERNVVILEVTSEYVKYEMRGYSNHYLMMPVYWFAIGD